jgi:hypothetical protein
MTLKKKIASTQMFGVQIRFVSVSLNSDSSPYPYPYRLPCFALAIPLDHLHPGRFATAGHVEDLVSCVSANL